MGYTQVRSVVINNVAAFLLLVLSLFGIANYYASAQRFPVRETMSVAESCTRLSSVARRALTDDYVDYMYACSVTEVVSLENNVKMRFQVKEEQIVISD